MKDSWSWPKKSKEFLFPSTKDGKPLSKDVVAHAIGRARRTFSPPGGYMDVSKIRSHSGRHRMINDLKAAGISTEVGMAHARIKHRKTYDSYGIMSQEQIGFALNSNKALKKRMNKLYS